MRDGDSQGTKNIISESEARAKSRYYRAIYEKHFIDGESVDERLAGAVGVDLTRLRVDVARMQDTIYSDVDFEFLAGIHGHYSSDFILDETL